MRPASIGVVAGLATGVGVAVASRGPTLVAWPGQVRRIFPYALGTLVGAGVGIAAGAGAASARLIAGRGRRPSLPAVAATAVAIGAIGGAATLGRRAMLGRMEAEGRGLDPGFAEGPDDPGMSGSPASLVPLLALGREGARFVSTSTTADDVRLVMGSEPTSAPVRVFVGVDAAPTVEARVALAMAELERSGAFERACLLIQAPAGSGYANATPADVLEICSRGDAASVAVGYGLLPSFLSLGKVPIAAQTQALLIESIAAALAGRRHRPRLLLYGESLGAKVQQAAIPAGLADLDRLGIDAALWVGTPGSQQSDAFHARCAESSITVDRPEQIPVLVPEQLTGPILPPRPRVWFLEHDGDPVVRFRPEVFAHRPAWLGIDGDRGRNVPATMRWKPGITWAQALVDTMFATNVRPGQFQSLGHDYRADLGAVVRAAFDLPVDAAVAARLEERLRALEIQRAERINGSSVDG
ncbi:MAG: alpha/beta-hydrolase family protein [Actinomycetales bacterium]|nr:alpha/beta-hydrolase family protein [Actinomycetales bacterium]